MSAAAAISIQQPDFLKISNNHGTRNRHHRRNQSFPTSSKTTMAMDSKASPTRNTEEQLSLLVGQHQVSSPKLRTAETSSPMNLRFDRLQPTINEELDRMESGNFVAREALLDEEYWTAAWLRAESHWEDLPNDRYVDSHKRKFAEQEFNALKRRHKSQLENKCACIVAEDKLKMSVLEVKKEEKNVKRTVLKSLVGTLDLSIRYLLPGETFPGERVKASPFCTVKKSGQSRYGYISNLCVSKSARRQGIASNMLRFAIRQAKSNGVEEVFVHVHRNNKSAQELYQKIGFQLVETATAQLSEEKTYLFCLK